MARKAGPDIWVFAEQRGGILHEVALELVSKGRELADSTASRVVAILMGHRVEGMSEALISHGADQVIVVDSPHLDPYRIMPYVSALERACREYDPDVLLLGATAMGMELAARLAARLRTGLSAHCIDLQLDEEGDLLQMVPGWGGGVVATIRCPDRRPQMATVMPGVMKKTRVVGRGGEVLRFDLDEELDLSGPRVLEIHKEEPAGVPLEGADVVVAGGWGVGSPEGWRLVEELARVLGGAVGATRPAVDEGWAREDQMIGQSGKTIRPCLYIGVGISGMMHHTVGMDESEYVISINRDAGAAIFQLSDLAVVGDYQNILPPLIEEIKRRRGMQ